MSEALKKRKKFYNTTIPVDWEGCELNQLSEKIMVGIASAATHAYRNEGIILFRNQNIKNGYLDDADILFIDETYEIAHKNKRLKGGDILIARTGYPGTACLVPDKYLGSQSFTTLIVRPKHELIYNEFLCLYVNSEYGQGYFETNQIGGGQKNVNAGTLEIMPIPLPSIPEQKAIAQVLSTAVAAIQITEKLIFQKERRKKWLMQQLLTGKKRLKGFSGEWKEMQIGDFIIESRIPSIYNDVNNRITVKLNLKGIEKRDVRGSEAEDATFYFIRKKGQFIYGKQNLHKGALGIVPVELDGFESSQDIPTFDFNDSVNPIYFYLFMSQENFYQSLERISTGTGSKRIHPENLYKVKVNFPTKKEQTAIANVLLLVDKEINLLKAKSEKLRLQKKGLMHILLTGKVRLNINNYVGK
jgi:type I restriction enzyme S subunit